MMNPIFQRELVGLLRTRKAYAIQAILIGVLTAFVVIRWPDNARADFGGEQAQAVLRLFGYSLLAGLILICPVFPAAAIVREKQDGTLALLIHSPLTPWDIFIGKLFGAAGFAMLLLVLSLPAATACYVMGGVAFVHQILAVYLILLLVALQYATLALCISARTATAVSALRLTYGAILLLAIVPLGPKQFTQGFNDPMVGQVVNTLACVSPIPAMMDVLGQGGIGSQGLINTGPVLQRYSIFAGISILMFTLLTLVKLNARIFDRNRPAGKVTDERSGTVRAYRRIMYLWFFDPQRRSGLIRGWMNPVMIKEFRTQQFGRSHWMMRIFGVCLLLSMGLMLATTRGTLNWGVDTLGGVIVILQTALLVLVAPSLASGVISGERESGGWTLLQMTPLSTFTIVSGKLLSAARTLLLLLLATLPAYGVMLAISPDQAPRILQVLITLILLAVLSLMVSAATSSVFRRSAPATAVSYGILVALCGGTMLFWMGRDAPFPRGLVEQALRLNPLATALSLINTPSFREYSLAPANWYVMGAGIVLSTVVLSVQTWRLARPQ